MAVFTFLSNAGFSQEQPPLFNHQQWYKIEDGLPQGFITGIVQDKQGFIWAGTQDGVVRFDGKNFRTFRHDPADSTSLSGNSAGRFTIDENGKILVLSIERGTMDELDPETGYCKHLGDFFKKAGFYNSAYIQKGIDGKWMYFNNGQTGWIDPAQAKRIPFAPPGGLAQDESFFGMPLKWKDGQWLLPSSRALYFLDDHFKVTRKDVFPQILSNPPIPDGNGLSDFVAMPGNRLALMTASTLYTWDIKNRQLISLTLPEAGGREYRCKLQVGHDGLLYMVRFDKVYRLEANNQFTLIWKNTLQPGRQITSMLIDRSGVLWLGLDAAGLVKVTLQSMPFSTAGAADPFHKNVLRMLAGPGAQLGSAINDPLGAYMFRWAPDQQGGYFLGYPNKANSTSSLFHFINGKMMELHLPPAEENACRISGLCCTPAGETWAYDENFSRILHWGKDETMGTILDLPRDSFPATRVWSWGGDLMAAGGSLWLTTNGSGLYQLKDGKVVRWIRPESKPAGLPANLSDICPDPADSNFFWVGSLGSGMFRINRLSYSVQNITMKEGLPNNTVYSIVPDKMGNLWVSTNNGIARFDPRTGIVHSFEKNDGLPGNEYNRAHNFRFPDGRIAFGGTEGTVVFDPADFKLPANMVNTNLQLTAISVNGKEQVLGASGSLLDTALSRKSILRLPYNRNFVSIEFVSLLFNDPQKIRYRYRLLGVEEEWNEAGHTNVARYTQLRPGTYTFQVNATGFDGRYTADIKELKIVVSSPFWASWWAWISYALIAIGGGWLWFRYYQKRRAEKARQIAEHQEAERLRQLDAMKEQFFSNITHELRTPITLITAPLEQLSRKPGLDSDVQQLVATAQNNSDRMLRLINQILDINKMDAGYLKLQETIGEPALFFAACVEKFRARATEKSIRLNSDFSAIAGTYLFDHEKWETILFNLLSNALKFTPAGGSVTMTVSADETSSENLVMMELSDTGIGIAGSELAHVFDRYYQAGSQARRYDGTGIGLALVKELVQLMGGTIAVDSEPGKGTSFILSIPMKKAGDKPHTELSPIPNLPGPEKDLLSLGQEPLQNEPTVSDKIVLIVEDNDELRSYITSTLAPSYKVINAANGAEGREKMLAEMPDLVISDMMMPVMDGVEFCRLCKADGRTAHIPFVLLTSRASQDAKLEGLGSGADDYLTKPFNITELQLRLANLLDQQQRLRQYWEQQLNLQTPAIPAAADPFVQDLYHFIDERLDDSALDVEAMARQMGLSLSSLNRKLKALTGTSPNDLVRTYRLKKAAGLLTAGHDISEVAYMTGFTSPSYFTRRFKEFFGKTPSSYLS
ncbi:MAG: ATP-binding protein [Bacteroidota bacterium]